MIRHPVAQHHEKTLDSLRGEFIEPRVKPGMTKVKLHSYLGGEDGLTSPLLFSYTACQETGFTASEFWLLPAVLCPLIDKGYMMALMTAFTPEDIKKAAAQLKELRPAYLKMLDFYEDVFVAQEESKKNIDIAPIQISDELLSIKSKQRFSLIDPADFVIDMEAASRLCLALCDVAKTANPHLTQSAQKLLDAINRGFDLKSAFTHLLKESHAQIDKTAKQLDIEHNVLIFFLYNSINPSIRLGAEQLSVYLDRQDPWQQGYCPICGSPPVLSVLEDEGRRSLICSFCWHPWSAKRGMCPFCDKHGKKISGYFFSEEEKEYRVYTCDNCKKYMKTIDTVKADRLIYPPLEQVVTLHLDMQANQKGYQSGLPGFDLTSIK